MPSAAVFEELPPLPDCVPLLPSSPVIPSVIEIPNDPKVDELISEPNEGITFVSRGPFPASSSHVPRPSHSRQVKTQYHVVPESLNTSPAPLSVLPDPSDSLTISVPVHRCNSTISIQPVPGPSRKRSQCKEEPPFSLSRHYVSSSDSHIYVEFRFLCSRGLSIPCLSISSPCF